MAVAAPDSFEAFLARGIGPKAGMWRIDLPTQSYQHASTPLLSTLLLNYYMETQPADARAPYALIPTPGLTRIPGETFGAGPVLESAEYIGITYVLSGDHFYRMTNYTATPLVEDLGYVGTMNLGPIDHTFNGLNSIACGPVGTVVCVPPNAFACSHTGPLNQLGGTFPGARSVTYIDGYYVFTTNDFTSQFFCSLLFDPTAFDALDFASADGVPSVIRRGFTINGELCLVGDNGIEFWYNAGVGSGFPFARRVGGVIPIGVRSVRSCAIGSDAVGVQSLWWVSSAGVVYRTVGYQPQRVSTNGIERLIREAGAANILRAFFYRDTAHAFYCLTIGIITICYDVLEGKWHNRSSRSGVFPPEAWRATCVTQSGDQVKFGDSRSGGRFLLDPNSDRDDGFLVERLIQLAPLRSRGYKAFCNRIEIELEAGVATGPLTMALSWTDDGTANFNTTRLLNTGAPGATEKRVVVTRLGSYRQRAYQIGVTGGVTVYAVDADITQPMAG